MASLQIDHFAVQLKGVFILIKVICRSLAVAWNVHLDEIFFQSSAVDDGLDVADQ